MKYIPQLKKQKEILNVLFDRIDILDKSYRKEGWTGKEVLIHLKDTETLYYDRIRRVIAEDMPILWNCDQDLWQKNLDYSKQGITLAKNLFLSTRDSVIEIVEMHLRKHAKKEAVHSKNGIMNMEQLVEYVVWHTDRHIKHLKSIKPTG